MTQVRLPLSLMTTDSDRFHLRIHVLQLSSEEYTQHINKTGLSFHLSNFLG
jgi:hypothetical protein